jgi:hypothetical protein
MAREGSPFSTIIMDTGQYSHYSGHGWSRGVCISSIMGMTIGVYIDIIIVMVSGDPSHYYVHDHRVYIAIIVGMTIGANIGIIMGMSSGV